MGSVALERIAAAESLDALEGLRVEFLGKQGSISALLKTLGVMSPDQRQAEGPKIHALRESVTEALATREAARAMGFGLMVGCMVGSSLAIAPAVLLAQGAPYVDLDAPLLLAEDRAAALRIEGSTLYPPEPSLWG